MIAAKLIGKQSASRVITITAARPAHHDSSHSAVAPKQEVKPEELDNPNFFQKIALRFQGIPLKGEKARPKSLFDDIGKYGEFPPLPKVPNDYKEFPERDLVKYPYPEIPAYAPKCRFVIVPDAWCKAIEKITGTSGPYLTIGGIVAFLINKEWFIFGEHGMYLVFGVLPLYLVANIAFRYRLDNHAYELWKDFINQRYAVIEDELKEAVEFRKTSKEQAESLKAAQENFPTIFRENLALQLEATYRKNVEYASNELKRRLDYLQEVQATKERFTREIVLKTITEGVRKQIETNEGAIREKYMDQCIEQLKVLAPK